MTKPLNPLYHTLTLLWLYSGIIPILFAQDVSLNLLYDMGFSHQFAWVLLIGASVMDISFGVLIFGKYRYYQGFWLVQFITIVIYNLLMILLLPTDILTEQLLHPFAPIIKNIPILAMVWFLYQHHKPKNQPN